MNNDAQAAKKKDAEDNVQHVEYHVQDHYDDGPLELSDNEVSEEFR